MIPPAAKMAVLSVGEIWGEPKTPCVLLEPEPYLDLDLEPDESSVNVLAIAVVDVFYPSAIALRVLSETVASYPSVKALCVLLVDTLYPSFNFEPAILKSSFGGGNGLN